MTQELQNQIESKFTAVINATVGDESKASELSMCKTAVNFLVMPTVHNHDAQIGNSTVTFPTYLIGSMDGAVHYISQSTLEAKALYEALSFTEGGTAVKFNESRKIVSGFMQAKAENWENLAIEFEGTKVGYVFDTQNNEHKKSRVSLFKVRPMTTEEREIADIVRKARAAKQA